VAVTRKLDIADIHCRMLPTIAPFLQHPVIQVDQEVLSPASLIYPHTDTCGTPCTGPRRYSHFLLDDIECT